MGMSRHSAGWLCRTIDRLDAERRCTALHWFTSRTIGTTRHPAQSQQSVRCAQRLRVMSAHLGKWLPGSQYLVILRVCQ